MINKSFTHVCAGFFCILSVSIVVLIATRFYMNLGSEWQSGASISQIFSLVK